jgi:hypothetical protein
VRIPGVWLAVAVVLSVLGPVGPAQAVDVNPEWGNVSAKSVPLKKSCRNYRYHYEVTPPEAGDWDLSVDVVAPNGRVVWFGYLWEGAFPDSGVQTFRLCRSQAQTGRYKLRAKVSNQVSNEVETFRLRTARFRLR